MTIYAREARANLQFANALALWSPDHYSKEKRTLPNSFINWFRKIIVNEHKFKATHPTQNDKITSIEIECFINPLIKATNYQIKKAS